MRVLFVDPPGKNKGLNTGLAYLCATLKKSHEVRVLDLNNIEVGLCGDPNPEMPVGELERRIAGAIDEFEPELLGVSVKTFTARIAGHIIRLIKDTRPEILTVVGGPHIALDGSAFIRENRADLGIQGEAEHATLQLCDALQDNGSVENVEGLYHWADGQLVHNPKSSVILDLDTIPFPQYDDFSSVRLAGGHLTEYPLLTSRGCPYECSYCCMPSMMGKRWRCHSPTRVIEELQHAKDTYGSASFTVVDDNFTLSLKRVEGICDLLISEQAALPWNSQNGIRADRISADLADKMRRSGCQYVWVGIESADEEVFNQIGKGEALADVKKGIAHLKRAGIRVGGFFIIGLPHSTKETDLKAIDFVKEHGIDGWWFNFVPYPHTQAWDWVQRHGKVLCPSDGVAQYGTNSIEPVFETDDYSKDSRIEAYDEIHIRMRHFDRLADPSLGQWARWQRAFGKALPFGVSAVLSLLASILRHNAKLLVGRLKRRLPVCSLGR